MHYSFYIWLVPSECCFVFLSTLLIAGVPTTRIFALCSTFLCSACLQIFRIEVIMALNKVPKALRFHILNFPPPFSIVFPILFWRLHGNWLNFFFHKKFLTWEPNILVFLCHHFQYYSIFLSELNRRRLSTVFFILFTLFKFGPFSSSCKQSSRASRLTSISHWNTFSLTITEVKQLCQVSTNMGDNLRIKASVSLNVRMLR